MSSSFSFLRLGKLITKQLFENSRLYIFSVLALFGLLALVLAFWISVGGRNYHEEETWIIFLFGLFIAGSVFASMAFSMLDSKDKGIYWLGLPATHLEKLICTIFYTTIVFTAVYCICFFVIKWIAIAFLLEFIKDKPGVIYTEVADYSQGFGAAIPYFIYAYFAVQAFYLLGAVYFARYTFIMTTVVGALLIFAFGFYISRIDDNMFEPLSWDLTTVKQFKTDEKDSYLLYSISSTVDNVLKYLVQFGCAPLFWIVTWFRLKEKEV
jgi:hypothetical protein